MRKFLTVLCLLLSSNLFAQSVSTQVISRVRDATDPNAQAKVERPSADNKAPAGVYALDTLNFGYCFDGATWDRVTCAAAGDALPATTQGQVVIGLSHFYNSTSGNYQRMTGATNASDNIATTTAGVWNNATLYAYDASGGNWDRVLMLSAGDTVSSTQAGVSVVSSSLFYDGTQFRRWLGATQANDNIATTTVAPWTGAFNYAYDATGGNWDRMTLVTSADNLSATPQGLSTISQSHFYDGSNFRRLLGATQANDNIATTTVAPWGGSFLYGYDSSGGNWDRLNVNTSGELKVATSGAGAIKDGVDSIYADVEDNNADGKATTLNPLSVWAVLYGYNGSTLDMIRSGASKELTVTDIVTRPGEDWNNNRRDINKSATGVYAPAKETSGQILATPVVVLAAKEILGYPNCCIYMKNLDASQSLTDVDLQVSPDNTTWIDLTEPSSCDTLAAGVSCVTCLSNNAYRYVRLRATAAAVAADVDSVDVFITCNAN